MKVQSFIRLGPELAPVEVELSLTPGLPLIQFLGLPDAALKESALRIRSALREQGFQLPQAHQVLVNLKPTHLRKSSRGLDLAVAAALLWEMGQIEKSSLESVPTLYGELTLGGEVVCPDDINDLDPSAFTTSIMTGVSAAPLPFDRWELKTLKDLASPTWIERQVDEARWIRPTPPVREFSKRAAEAAQIIAAGEHSALLAGPPGGGKSTLAEAIASWLEEPEEKVFRLASRHFQQMGVRLEWRPVLRPHHSITPLAMIGGGATLWPGQITRVHGGVLIMDELLEFHGEIQEALREPLETGQITLARAGNVRIFPAQFLLLATTNLCPCGAFVPRRQNRCRCSRASLRKALGRLTGPFVDRFAVLELTDEWEISRETVSCAEIGAAVREAIAFRRSRGQQVPNSRLNEIDLEKGLSSFQMKFLVGSEIQSRRRRLHVLRVARTLADLRSSERIENEDIDRALEFALKTHRALESWQP